MSAEASRQIEKALFETARGIANPEARQEFLAAACAGNSARLERLKSWLGVADDAEAFFQHAVKARSILGEEVGNSMEEPAAPPEGRAVSEGPGSRIGRYALLERLGEGGWGVVYLAEQQEPVRRRVALKIIRLGLDTEKVVARFEAERQALALMDHPNIARVLDAGATDSGRPYFVMELVHGVRITEHCDTGRLGLRQRLELFIQVCHAIQHAHQKGIIHRDIKPSNVLVSSQPGADVPKVIDFGVAMAIEGRLAEHTIFTGADHCIGTPAYMSPEQAEAGRDVDTRSDVYSLGALLCELLTGAAPFDGQRLASVGTLDMLRILREEEPPAPSAILAALGSEELATVADRRGVASAQLISEIKGDLDWIVLKALAKDRHSRYGAVNGLALDIRRFLDDEPIQARPPSRLYLLGKLVRRNKVVFASAVAVALALVVGLATASRYYLSERDARQAQVKLREAAETARANETRMLVQSKAREAVSQAAILLAEGKTAEADAILVKTPLASIEPSIEAANVFRSLGDWNAIRERWQQAADCYRLYVQANRLERAPTTNNYLTTIGIASTMVEVGHFTEYRHYREGLNPAYVNTPNPVHAAIVLKSSLLMRADEALLARLRPAGEVVAKSLAQEDGTHLKDLQSAFMAMSMGILDYRRGKFDEAMEWSRMCLEFPGRNEARDTTARAVLAMAAFPAQWDPKLGIHVT